MDVTRHRVRQRHRRAALLAAAIIASCLPAAATAGSPADVAAEGPAATNPSHVEFRQSATPLVVVGRSSTGDDFFDVYVRTNRPLPRFRNGEIAAAIRVADVGGDVYVGSFSTRARHCYTEPVDQSFSTSRLLKHPRIGATVRVRLYVHGERVAEGTGRLVPYVTDRALARRLGC
jgi:hypothetical protein